MSHPASEKLSLFLDDDLGATERTAIERHLAGCTACSDLIGDLRAVKERLGKLTDRPPAPALWRSVEQRLRARDAGTSLEARWPLRAAQLAAAALVVAGALSFWLRSAEPPTLRLAGSERSARSLYAAAADALSSMTSDRRPRSRGALLQAIADTRRALSEGGRDGFLEDHLERLERQRWRLLRSRATWTTPDPAEGGS